MKKTVSVQGVAGILLRAWTLFAGVTLFAQDWQFSTIHSFGNSTNSAFQPSSGLILASDGKLYGTALGGAHHAGVVFRANKDGSGFQIIYDFDGGVYGNGAGGPLAGLLEASDGKLYGTTLGGGSHLGGTVFCLNTDGSGFQVIHDFESLPDGTGASPYGELIEVDGLLYGTTRTGGSLGNGSVFLISKDGSVYRVLHEFDYNSGTGGFPEAPLLRGSDGVLYGTIDDHGPGIDSPGAGRIFRINPDGTGYAVLHDFNLKSRDGNFPGFGLTEGRDGALYGTTLRGGDADGGTVFKLRKNGSGYRVLWSLPSGSLPFGPLREAASGLLYGITEEGGPNRAGTMFSIDEDGRSPRVVDTFGQSSRDVRRPVGALAQDAAGNLYGGSMAGGIAGNGTLFRCPLTGGHQVLHSFNFTGGDGGDPDSPISLGTNGILYGATRSGGWFGNGTVYQLNSDGTGYKVLVNLPEPSAGVIADPTNSDLYLTTVGTLAHRNGNLYRLSQDGKLKGLHTFRSAKNSLVMPGIPLAASDGMLYGLVNGADKGNDGFIYRIQKNGKKFQVLYSFTNQSGTFPPLIEGNDGMLYGVQPPVSPLNHGTAFKIAKDGTSFTVLHSFGLYVNLGWYSEPAGPLVEGSDGLIYGLGKGTYDSSGAVYRMDKGGGSFQFGQIFPSGVSGLTKGSDGAIYGMAFFGSLFRIEASFSITTLGTPAFLEPVSGLIEFSNGEFIGTSVSGGDLNFGRIFKLTPPPAAP